MNEEKVNNKEHIVDSARGFYSGHFRIALLWILPCFSFLGKKAMCGGVYFLRFGFKKCNKIKSDPNFT